MFKMKLRTIKCRIALSKSRLSGYDYALNPYVGCAHSCIYCYAPYVLHEDRDWGTFLDVKENIPNILSKEVKKKRRGVVGISTVTDPYQPAERRFEVTRRCLEQLSRNDFPICVQTKSDLILRDIDLLKRFSRKEVGFTITTLNTVDSRKIEPNASSVEERLAALEALSSKGVPTWAFLGPIMPGIVDRDDGLNLLIESIKKAGADYLIADRLNIKRGMLPSIRHFIAKEYPDLEEKYYPLEDSYFEEIRKAIIRLCRENRLRMEFLY